MAFKNVGPPFSQTFALLPLRCILQYEQVSEAAAVSLAAALCFPSSSSTAAAAASFALNNSGASSLPPSVQLPNSQKPRLHKMHSPPLPPLGGEMIKSRRSRRSRQTCQNVSVSRELRQLAAEEKCDEFAALTFFVLLCGFCRWRTCTYDVCMVL